mgnify:CR=1 FL=1
MAKITIDKDKCKGCLLCINFCPKKLILKNSQLNKQGLNYVEFKENGGCIGCSFCAIICPDCCITVYK